MTRTEDNAWYWCAGVLVGEVLAFWFGFDVDYYRLFWPVGLAALIVWAIVRRGKDDNTQGKDGVCDHQ
jgi:hypothetical protein